MAVLERLRATAPHILFRNTDQPMHLRTIDRWGVPRATYRAFPHALALDRRGNALTVNEHRLGAFED
jgi:hypothetical protein